MNTRRGVLHLFSVATLTVAGLGMTDQAEAKRRLTSPRKSAPAKIPAKKSTSMMDVYYPPVAALVMVLSGKDIKDFRIVYQDQSGAPNPETGFPLSREELENARRKPASTTKMMTLERVFEALENKTITLEDRVTFSGSYQKATTYTGGGGGILGFKVGTTISVEEAILALVTKSANDAAVALAEKLEGTEERFAVRMTERAREIGMNNTVFKNSHGMPNEDQYTTAYDLALLARHLFLKYPQYYHYFSTPEFFLPGANKGKVMPNHNVLMTKYKYPGMDCCKTGKTDLSGWNLVAGAERESLRIFGIFLGGYTSDQRNNCLGFFLDQGFKSEGKDIKNRPFKYSDFACTSGRGNITSRSPQ